MALPLILGAASTVLGGILGAIERSGADAEAKELLRKAIETYQQAGMPPNTSLPLILKQFSQQGIITPELEKDIQMRSSEAANLQEAPEGREAQISALQQLAQVSKGGLRPEDRAAFNQLRDETMRQEEAKRQQIVQNMQARGVAGSGAELAAQLQSAQSGANTMAQRGDEISSLASQRALQALGQYGSMGGQVRGQDFSNSMAKAQAADALAQFNIQNQRALQTRNVGTLNDAQKLALAEKQRIADTNIQQANRETERQNQAKADDYSKRLDYYKGLAGLYGGQAQGVREQGKDVASGYQAAGTGLGKVFKTFEDQDELLKKKTMGG